MTSAVGESRSDRGESTRAAILTAAEQLFAEHGVNNVSHRQIVASARQGNNAAVAYHFGNKAELVRAIERKHADHVERRLAEHVRRVAGSTSLTDWIGCLVRSYTDHLASLGTPCWYARFCAQTMTDPVYAKVMTSGALTSSALQQVLDGIGKCLPELPGHVRSERHLYTRLLLNHVCAEYETSFAEGRPMPRTTWDGIGSGLIDAMVGLWRAPVSPDTEAPGD
ncbi:TetR/AcrR family transcriptional regulator [Mycobacterium ahvazicum]|uniref:TetR/AcrR family transcriptional regulator n=1 Tax=Mycobacterium ahvazicum TaxID=1964395 RepID=UPI001FAF6E11|nr:helix-turn-helix domain-containing protein [Mycobacterium ahvazicum]